MTASSLALTDRRCEECERLMAIIDRTPGGAITLYSCPVGHLLFVSAQGEVLNERAKS